MSRTNDRGMEPDDHLDIGRRVAARRAEAQRRIAVRRRRRQTLPALVVGSATLAGVGLAGSWVDARLPRQAPVAVVAPAGRSATAMYEARVDGLERQLTAAEQALKALSRMAGAAAKAGPGAIALPPGSTASTAVKAPVGAAAAAAPVVRSAVRAPAVHATTGASHAH